MACLHTSELLEAGIATALDHLQPLVLRCARGVASHSEHAEAQRSMQHLLQLTRWQEQKPLRDELVLLNQLLRPLLSNVSAARARVLPHVLRLVLRLNDAPRRHLARLCQQRQLLLEEATLASVREPLTAQGGMVHSFQALRCFLPDQQDASNGLKQTRQQSARQHGTALKNVEPQLPALEMPTQKQLNLNATIAVLKHQLQQRLQTFAQVCANSEWALAAFAGKGLARQCRELVQLAQFVDAHLCQQLQQLEAVLLSFHAAARQPTGQELHALLHNLLRLACGRSEGVHFAAATTAVTSITLELDEAALACARAELCSYADKLQTELIYAASTALQGSAAEPVRVTLLGSTSLSLPASLQSPAAEPVRVSETLLLVTSKLVWVLQALAQPQRSELAQCLLQTLLQYWMSGANLPPALAALMLEFRLTLLPLLEAPLQPAADSPRFHRLMSAVLAQWPERRNLPVQAIPLGAADGKSMQTLPLDAVPDYLSVCFTLLLSAAAEWFCDKQVFAQHATALHDELRLLEQGAAVMKLPALEAFGALLLDLHTMLQLPLPNLSFPSDLLWQAHQQLVAMLDRTAVWLEPQQDPDLECAMTDWLMQADAVLLQAVSRPPEQNADTRQLFSAEQNFATGQLLPPEQNAATWLLLQLNSFLRQTGKVLGRALRLTLQVDHPLQPVDQQALATALVALLRWTLLAHNADNSWRRQLLKPRALAVTVCSTLVDTRYCQAALTVDNCNVMLDAKQLARLQRLAGSSVTGLQCEQAQALGRRFVFRLQLRGWTASRQPAALT